MSTIAIADRLRKFVDNEMTFPGNPDVVIPELVSALCAEVQRLMLIQQEVFDAHTRTHAPPAEG